jgi:hypothetical protein
MFYILIETQVNGNTKAVVPPVIYTDYNAALAALYTALSAAAVSGLDYHSAILLSSDGVVMPQSAVFDRRRST